MDKILKTKFKNLLIENIVNEGTIFYRNDSDNGIVIPKSEAKLIYTSKIINGTKKYFLTREKEAKQEISYDDYCIARDGILKFLKNNPSKSEKLKDRLNVFSNKNVIKLQKEIDELLSIINDANDIVNSQRIHNEYVDKINFYIKEYENYFNNKENISQEINSLKNNIDINYNKIEKLIEKSNDVINEYKHDKNLKKFHKNINNVCKNINYIFGNLFNDINELEYKNNNIENNIIRKNISKDYQESLKFFDLNLLIQFDKCFNDKLKDNINNFPKNIKDILLKFKDILNKRIEINNGDGISNYNRLVNKIFYNRHKIYNNTDVFFHEIGHFIDNNVKRQNILNENYISFYSDFGKEFIESLNEDVNNIIDNRKNDIKKLTFEEYCKKYNLDTKNNVIFEKYSKFNKHEINENDFISYILMQEIENNVKYNRTIGNIKDIISLVSNGEYYIGGHKKEDCLRQGGNSYKTTTESFANLFQIYCTRKTDISVLEKYFSKSNKIFNKLLDIINS